MKAQSLPPEQKRYSDAIIEVQLGSVLMHAWAEVEHDLIYKPDSGVLSEDETAIIDELNGLVLAGEIALERLQRALERRLSGAAATFENHYELAAFIHNSLRQSAQSALPSMGRVDVLWELLREVKKNNTAALSPILNSLEDLEGDETLADQLADAVLSAHPELYKRYVAIQSHHAGQVSTDRARDGVDQRYGGLGEFITHWVLVESTVNEIGYAISPTTSSKGVPLERVISTLGMSKDQMNLLRRLRTMRNQLIHGIDVPSKQLLEPAIREFRDIFEFFKGHPDQSVREAYRRARRNLGLGDDEG